MVKTVQAAMSPLLSAGFLCGFNFFVDSLGRTRPYLTCLYFAISWSLYGYLMYYFVFENNIAYKYYIDWLYVMLIPSVIITIVVNLYQFKKLKTCLHLLSVVNDTLEALGTSKEYRRMYIYVFCLTIVWIVGIIVVNMLDAYSFIYAYNCTVLLIVVPFVANQILHINILCSLTWGTILGYICTRFSKIKEHLCNVVKDSTGCISKRSKKNVIEQRIKARKYMWIIMDIHLQLCLISRELNNVFSVQMTMQMLVYFLSCVGLSRDIYTSYMFLGETSSQVIIISRVLIYLWVAIFSAQLIALNYICQSVCDKANDAVAILYQLFNNKSYLSCDKDLYELALQFILQIRQRKLTLSGMGLFDLGYKFIHQFYKAAMTVLVIVIQMDLKNASSEMKLSHNDSR